MRCHRASPVRPWTCPAFVESVWLISLTFARSDGALEVERSVSPDRVMEPVDSSGDRIVQLLARLPCNQPDMLCAFTCRNAVTGPHFVSHGSPQLRKWRGDRASPQIDATAPLSCRSPTLEEDMRGGPFPLIRLAVLLTSALLHRPTSGPSAARRLTCPPGGRLSCQRRTCAVPL